MFAGLLERLRIDEDTGALSSDKTRFILNSSADKATLGVQLSLIESCLSIIRDAYSLRITRFHFDRVFSELNPLLKGFLFN